MRRKTLFLIFICIWLSFKSKEAEMKEKKIKNELDNVLILYESISHGAEPHANFRWKITKDGKHYLSRNVPPVCPPKSPFNRPFPKKPTFMLDKDKLEELKEILKKNIPSLKEFYKDENVLDGGYDIITVNLDGKIYKVILDNIIIKEIKEIEDYIEIHLKKIRKIKGHQTP